MEYVAYVSVLGRYQVARERIYTQWTLNNK